jgi:hypothetical protein
MKIEMPGKNKKCFVCVNSILNTGNKKFCSNVCRGKYLKSNGIKPPPRTGQVPWNKGLDWKEMSILKMGKNNPSWKGGKWVNQRHIAKMKRLKAFVFLRDDYKCVVCGSLNNLQIDHKKCFAHHEELRFTASNLRTLCILCHRKTINHGNHTCNK